MHQNHVVAGIASAQMRLTSHIIRNFTPENYQRRGAVINTGAFAGTIIVNAAVTYFRGMG